MGIAAVARDASRVHAVDSRHDDDLVVEALRDVQAFGVLYERHMPRVYAYLRAKGASEHDAGDLTSTTFERALVRLATYRPGRSGVLPWLLGIARNAWVDEWRRVQRVTEPLTSLSGIMDPGASPEAAVVAAERVTRLQAEIARLPEAAQDGLSLRYGAGLTAAEIAPLIGKSEAATKKILVRAVRALRSTWTDAT